MGQFVHTNKSIITSFCRNFSPSVLNENALGSDRNGEHVLMMMMMMIYFRLLTEYNQCAAKLPDSCHTLMQTDTTFQGVLSYYNFICSKTYKGKINVEMLVNLLDVNKMISLWN